MDSHVIYELYLAAEHVTEPVRLRQLAATRLPVIACDTETTGLDPHGSAWLHGCKQSWLVHNRIMPFGISLAFPLEDKVALCWARRGTVLWFAALDVLACPTRKTWHNARYDMRVCQDNGIALNGEQDDTLTMSRIWWDRRKAHGLEALTEMLCPHLCEWKRKFDREWRRLQSYCTRHKRPEGWCNYSLMPDELVGEYAKVDAFMGLVVWSRLWPQVGKTDLYRREMRVLRAILEVEKRGLAFDAGKARGLAKEMRKRIRTCKQNLPVGMKPGSPASVLAYLLAAGANKDKLRVKGKLTTGVEVLRELLIEQAGTPVASLVQDVLEYRALTKTVNTYLVKLADLAERQDGIIYTTINPADTKTSRMTSSAPNLENIPKLRPRGSELDEDNPTRSCFGPRAGNWWYLFDYVQMELAMFGWYTEDEFICRAYERGEDLHLAMAKRIYGEDCTPHQRTLSKNVTFGCIALDTPILTENGWKPLHSIQKSDNVWNGQGWVRHDGLIRTGEQPCVFANGIWATTEHEIWHAGRWTTAGKLSTHSQSREVGMGTSPLYRLTMGRSVALSPFTVAAIVVQNGVRRGIVSLPEEQLSAVSVGLKRLVSQEPNTISFLQNIGNDYRILCIMPLVGVTADQIETTVNAAFRFVPNGEKIEPNSLRICLHWKDGTTRSWSLAELIIMGTTHRETYGSLRRVKVCETGDLTNTGHDHCYQAGNNIVANCIYGMQERKLLTYLAIPKKEAQDLLAFYHETFPSIRAFQEEVERRLTLDGYVEDFFGKRYTLPPELAYKGVNRLVQGGCAQAFKCGFLAMDTWLNETRTGQILLPIHDEWIVESRLEKGSSGADYLVEEVQERMENIEILVNKGRRFRVDVKVTDSNWAAKESYQKP